VIEDRERVRDPERDKVSITFSGSALKALQDLADREDISLAEAAERALGLSEWYWEMKDEGATIVADFKDRRVTLAE
jgi:hypothetical protein